MMLVFLLYMLLSFSHDTKAQGQTPPGAFANLDLDIGNLFFVNG